MNIVKRTKYILLHIKKIGIFSTFNYFVQRLSKPKGGLIKLHIARIPHPIFLRSKTYDVYIFYQIFIKEDLLLDYGDGVSIILDCGANIGLATLYYQKKFPNARIICIEPESENYNLLLKNIKKYSNITAMQIGVSGEDCDLNVIDIGQGEASYRTMPIYEKGKILQTIKCKSINTIMKEFQLFKLDILKMDIEGSEKECLLAPDIQWVQKVKYFLLEIHENINPGITEKIFNLIPTSSEISYSGEYTIIKSCLNRRLL